jgi:hypothetical protein
VGEKRPVGLNMLLYQYGDRRTRTRSTNGSRRRLERSRLKPEVYEKTYRESVRQIDARRSDRLRAPTLYITRSSGRSLSAGERGPRGARPLRGGDGLRYGLGQISV